MTLDEARSWIVANEIRPAIRRGRCLPLLPRHRVYLRVDAGDGPAFARLFRATWDRLPLGARRRILGYWRGDLSGLMPLSPSVELGRGWPDMGRKDLAMVSRHGHRMRFRSSVIRAMSKGKREGVAQDLIAHELAHVYQSARGIRCGTMSPEGYPQYFDAGGAYWGGAIEIEDDADWQMDRWGFDAESIDRWSLETGRSRVVEVESLYDPRARKFLERFLREGR
jgi:hypothetical protein